MGLNVPSVYLNRGEFYFDTFDNFRIVAYRIYTLFAQGLDTYMMYKSRPRYFVQHLYIPR